MKYLNIDWSKWITSKCLHNYIIEDPLLDWLNMYNYLLYEKYPKYRGYLDTKNNSKFNYQRFLYNLSIKFRGAIFKNLNNRFPGKVHNVLYNKEYKSIDKFKKTKKLMKKKIPIITNPLLYDYDRKIYSTPDLLVRSDYIQYIYDCLDYKTDNSLKVGCIYSNKWHYKIINIKYCSLKFNSDNKTIRNKVNIKKYKTDTILANMLLSNIQKYNSNISYIQGYCLTINNKSHQSFYKLGEINTKNNDNMILEKIHNSIRWIKSLKKEGHLWKIGSRSELYPNMCNRNDYPYHEIKKKIADKLCEISLIWNIGINERNDYHKNNIYSYKNIKYHKNSLIDKIIKTNTGSIEYSIKDISVNNYIPSNIKKFYIDLNNKYNR